jgi:hypothetical protein
MQGRQIITLTTDFGNEGPFVGIIKGVVLNINPDINIVDICHNIRPYNILEAAFIIGESYKVFPRRTIHLVVVDPGVGTSRRPILVAAGSQYFVGPDNGVFTRIYKEHNDVDVIHIKAEHYFLKNRSSTFHGRDIFAPVAAWLSKGIDILKFGDAISDYVVLDIPKPVWLSENVIEGEIIYIDRFGNLNTNLRFDEIEKVKRTFININTKLIFRDINVPYVETYGLAEDKGLHYLLNSFGYYEIFVNRGNASEIFKVEVGEKVRLISPNQI